MQLTALRRRLLRGEVLMNKLAVIVPTRSRPQNVASILTAWAQTSAWSVADLWWIVDADDAELPKYHEALDSFAGPFRLHIVPEWRPLVTKLNASAVGLREQFGYQYLAFMGDDHIPRTPMWAHMLIEDHEMRPRRLRMEPPIFVAESDLASVTDRHGGPRFARGVGIVYGQDGIQNKKLPTWWSMDARIIDKLGRMVPAPVQHLYCDNAVKALGEKTDQLLYDERILIEHMHPVAGKAPVDAQYSRVNRPEQYGRDANLFNSWVADGLDRDASLLADIWG